MNPSLFVFNLSCKQAHHSNTSTRTAILLATLLCLLCSESFASTNDKAVKQSPSLSAFITSLSSIPNTTKHQGIDINAQRVSPLNTKHATLSGSTSTLRQQVFDTELSAVVHAMNTYNPVSIAEDREYIGAVYQLDQGRGYLYSVMPGRLGSNIVRTIIPKMTNATIIAVWHTHGADHWTRRFFSNLDTKLVRELNLPFYMGCADGQLRVFRPGDPVLSFRQAGLRGLGQRQGFALGHEIPGVKITTR